MSDEVAVMAGWLMPASVPDETNGVGAAAGSRDRNIARADVAQRAEVRLDRGGIGVIGDARRGRMAAEGEGKGTAGGRAGDRHRLYVVGEIPHAGDQHRVRSRLDGMDGRRE